MRKVRALGLPYMGSKRVLAPRIVGHILAHNPKVRYLYDLFGGGGAISLYALQMGLDVYYNELDTAIVALLEHIRDNGITPDMFRWVSKETFFRDRYRQDYWGGFVSVVWSFGNNREKGYLFGEENERIKKLAHEMIVFDSDESLAKLEKELGIDIPIEIHSIKDIHKKRKYLQGLVKANRDRVDLQQLEGLARLQQLEQLEQLERLERLNITNLSFEEVKIETPIEETIIYLDPPYKGTEQYQENEDNLHDKIDSYIKNSPYKIYLSSYEWEGLNEVKAFPHKSTLSATNNSKRVVEKLFCNREELKTALF